MTAGDVFLLVLIVMVLPCSSSGGKCLVTKHGLSDLKDGFCCREERFVLAQIAGVWLNLALLLPLALLLQKNKLAPGHAPSPEVPSTYSSWKDPHPLLL